MVEHTRCFHGNATAKVTTNKTNFLDVCLSWPSIWIGYLFIDTNVNKNLVTASVASPIKQIGLKDTHTFNFIISASRGWLHCAVFCCLIAFIEIMCCLIVFVEILSCLIAFVEILFYLIAFIEKLCSLIESGEILNCSIAIVEILCCLIAFEK